MNGRKITMGLLVAGLLLAAAGCDVPPSTPRGADGEVIKQVAVERDAEHEVVQALADARALYDYRLKVLKVYYHNTGAWAKRNWAEKEMANLEKAQTFTFTDIEPYRVTERPSIQTVSEATLVEMVLEARRDYIAAVEELIVYYGSTGEAFKESLADNIRQRFDPVRTYMYFLDAEVPPADLKPGQVIPEAEVLYEDALALHKKGKFIVRDYQKQRQALLKFLELVRTYPESTRVAYSAYYIGHIYRVYFAEHYRSLLWYKRAVQWDPLLEKPARFEAARVADFKLYNRQLAKELYEEVTKYETFDAENVLFANQRLAKLTARAEQQ